ncbi:DUF1007 family protein [Aureimonas psammosilenae]|uniref:DUF1007 family protein n=1 Tax=Aureimonas psammosilenae TaxID=2495496 RepID=UPI0012613A76|nr:DUF1007 family protein [Aureimonas psammosilenae]
MKLERIAIIAAAFGMAPVAASAHPHVFVEPKMVVVAGSDGHLKEVHNRWSMDEMFSSGVLVDFDANGDGKLERDELTAIGRQVAGSITRWSYYTFVRNGGVQVAMEGPPVLDVSYDTKAGRLDFDFVMKPKAPVDLKTGGVTFSNFDDTYFVAFDYKDAKQFTVQGMPNGCRAEMDAPNPDEAAKSWMATIAAIPADADVPDDGIKFSQVLSTKYRIACPKK